MLQASRRMECHEFVDCLGISEMFRYSEALSWSPCASDRTLVREHLSHNQNPVDEG